jgi:hypothetical protein
MPWFHAVDIAITLNVVDGRKMPVIALSFSHAAFWWNHGFKLRKRVEIGKFAVDGFYIRRCVHKCNILITLFFQFLFPTGSMLGGQ